MGLGVAAVAVADGHRPARHRRVHPGRAALRRRRAAAAAALPWPHLRHRLAAQLHPRHGDVRRAGRAAALPADREGRVAHRGRTAAAAADRRHHGRLDLLRARSSPAPAATRSSRSSGPACWSWRWACCRRSASTPRCGRRCVYAALFGLGLGFNMQPLVLAVQNAVPPQDMGVATSSATFFRQMGGTLGTAVFLSILFSTVGDKIVGAFRSAARPRPSRPRSRTRRCSPTRPTPRSPRPQSRPAARCRTGALDDTSFLSHLDPGWPGRSSTASPARWTWSSGSPPWCSSWRFVVVFFLPEEKLRTMSGIQAAAAAGCRRGRGGQLAAARSAPPAGRRGGRSQPGVGAVEPDGRRRAARGVSLPVGAEMPSALGGAQHEPDVLAVRLGVHPPVRPTWFRRGRDRGRSRPPAGRPRGGQAGEPSRTRTCRALTVAVDSHDHRRAAV